YGKVTERYESGSDLIGKTVYEYEINPKDKIHFNYGFGGSYLQDRSFLRGQLKKESYLDDQNNVIKEVSYEYETLELPQRTIGVRIGKAFEVCSEASGGACVYCTSSGWPEVIATFFRSAQIVLNAIQETSTWKRLISKTETVDGVITTTTFSYDPQVAHTNIV